MTSSQLIVQRDQSIIVTPGHNQHQVAAVVRACAELRKVVAGSFLYRLSSIALWGSAARGMTAAEILANLDRYAVTDIPAPMAAAISEQVGRYGILRLEINGDEAVLHCDDRSLLGELDLYPGLAEDGGRFPARFAGRVKLAAARAGWPVVDQTVVPAPSLEVRLNPDVRLRRYQQDAVESVRRAGGGVVLLPCGAGKTIVGVAVICQTGVPTLILGPSRSVAEQWRTTLLHATDLRPDQVSVLTGSNSGATPITIATYHAASMGQTAGMLVDVPWGLVIYDEVQSLPADVFRLSAALSVPQRLGLSATLVREDGRQREVYALVGPPVYDIPWNELESQGWIAPAICSEVRIPEAVDDEERLRFKQAAIERLLVKHKGQQVLVVGSSLAGIHRIGRRFGIPVLDGRSSRTRRSELLDAFRRGDLRQLVLSRIGSVGIDLPGAEVLIQVSGTFGSRQEEAQRLGRILRPGDGKVARFYTLVSEGTPEVRYAEKRQRFLVEQGYTYDLFPASELPRVSSATG